MATTTVWLARPAASTPAGDDWLLDEERAVQDGLRVAVRRAGWRLRRFTGKEAMAGMIGDPVEVRSAEGGRPEPFSAGERLPWCLSLSDRDGWAVCAVAAAPAVVGCDIELIEGRSEAFVSDYFTPAERALVGRATDTPAMANLIWSAKESALKVIGEGLRRPTRSVDVTLDPTHPGWSGWSPLRVRLAEGGELSGWWRRFGRFVVTVVSDPPGGPPVALDSVTPH